MCAVVTNKIKNYLNMMPSDPMFKSVLLDKTMKFYICRIFSMYYLRLFINWRLTSLYPTDTFNKSPRRIASLQKKLEKFTSNRYDTALYRLNKELFEGYDQYVKSVRSSKTVINVTIDFTLRIIL